MRYPHIDALRGLAALYVVFGHALNWYFRTISPDVGLSFEWLKQFTSALSGVFLFFAISGYVIPASFPEKGYEGARHFVIRRFFRLYPLFWVSILPNVRDWLKVTDPPYSLETLLYNFTMVPTLFNQGFVNAIYWTLAHELLFYGLCLGLHFLGWVQQSQKLALLTLATGMSYWGMRWGEELGFWGGASTFFQKTVLICLSIMFWGALWRCYQDKKWMGVWEKIGLLFIPMQCLILVVCRSFYSHATARVNFPISFATSIAVGIGVFMLGTTSMKCNYRICVWCGVISYPLYLFHMLIIHRLAIWWSRFYEGVPPFSIFALLALVGSVILAALLHYLIERPFMVLSRKITQRQRRYAPN